MDLYFSRILTGTTLGFHIFFATLGVGIPVLISLAEALGIRKRDPEYLLLAKRWAKGFVILVAVGVVTGTTIGLQINLLWPNFMKLAGEVISLPFMLEGFAFFLEAIFLGIYLYTWGRFKNPWIHWSFSLPVIIGSSMSAALITTVNAFMNAPAGFKLVDGKITDIDPVAAILNPATPSKVFHVLSSAYFMTACALAALTACYLLLRNRKLTYYKKALHLTMGVALIGGLLTAIAGDVSAKYMAAYNPEKLAAAEALFDTERGAPLLIGGLVDAENQTVTYKIELPNVLSFLSFGDFNAEVRGLNAFPKELQPPVVIHYMFQVMVASGVYGITISLLYLFARWRRWQLTYSKLLLWAIFLLGPFAIVGMELGWIFTEIGRKPWIIYGVMRLEDAVTSMTGIKTYFLSFLCLYFFIGLTTFFILARFFRRRPVEQDPYYLEIHEGRDPR
ncbi:cytochrome ubiquinol oxidase subunit I [Tumebacillus permanentifrigoris]|uniref:Cytochrome bd-I ubiquinol oxidase subunit 1 apoprotein n=1 Tax=Tumebacillus permanentifrigoris TaxID=378543 RepID=A0A316D8V3_9BACL|nr:cytochrome ubiquinol oxidase subunit I [Tumebacillus permanentifrigoris]PWK11240.1 cytochrome bd-I ubiquinol oxidase subunit 1 apoprotein [Tumebacillus permanentifrigoris]